MRDTFVAKDFQVAAKTLNDHHRLPDSRLPNELKVATLLNTYYTHLHEVTIQLFNEKDREITNEAEFAILTNEISKATFGKTVGDYKQFKGLENQNLRDHMTDLELIFTMLGEASTTAITKEEDSQGFDECKTSANKGGNF